MVDHGRHYGVETDKQPHLHGHEHHRKNDARDGGGKPQSVVKKIARGELEDERRSAYQERSDKLDRGPQKGHAVQRLGIWIFGRCFRCFRSLTFRNLRFGRWRLGWLLFGGLLFWFLLYWLLFLCRLLNLLHFILVSHGKHSSKLKNKPAPI